MSHCVFHNFLDIVSAATDNVRMVRVRDIHFHDYTTSLQFVYKEEQEDKKHVKMTEKNAKMSIKADKNSLNDSTTTKHAHERKKICKNT